MADFGFGPGTNMGGGLARGFGSGFALGQGVVGTYKFKKYTESGELAKDMDAALKGFAVGDGAAMIQLDAKLQQFGKSVKDVIGPHLAMQDQMRKQQEQQQAQAETQRRAGVHQRISNEIQPRPAFEQTRQLPSADLQQFGIGDAQADMMRARDEDEGDPNVETTYRPGSPGRQLNANDLFDLEGPNADPSKMASMMRLPGQMASDEALTENRIADTSVKKTQASILSDPAGHAKKLMTDIGLDNGTGETGRDIGYTVGPTGGVTVRNNPQRRAADAGNRIFNDVMEATGGNVEAATKAREDYERIIAAARGGGSQQGALDVKQTPAYQENLRNSATATAEGRTAGSPLGEGAQKEITGLEGVLRQVENIEKNFDPSFLGMVKGRDMVFEGRRQIGSATGQPLSSQETVFRQSLKDVQDQLLRARSGAAISPQEWERLSSILPKPTDEPGVFTASLGRFRAELQQAIQRKATLGATPRNRLGAQPNQAGPAAFSPPKVLGIERLP